MRIRLDRAIVAGLGCLAACLFAGCGQPDAIDDDAFVGAWRGKVQFADGPFVETKDLEFMYVFNSGGTMTESSNYDGSPPVPPAYGAWRKTGDRTYEARYEYFWTKAPAKLEALTKGGGWSPGGRGVLTQRITVSEDGRSFDSTIDYDVFDAGGKPADNRSHAKAQATRIGF